MENDSTTSGVTSGSSSSLVQAQLSQARAELNRLQQEVERLRSGMATSCKQRDVLRTSLQQRAVYSLALRNKNAELTREVERLIAKNKEEVESLLKEAAVERAAFQEEQSRLTSEAAKWQSQYLALYHRIEGVLNRFGILQIYRCFPLRFRTFVRDRFLGPGQAQ
jgi:chromosome segregation ATPase